MVKYFAWAFALLNLFPLLWMVWSSLLGSSEIQQGKIFPEPYPNDVVFLEKIAGGKWLAGTLHGQIYRFENGNFDEKTRRTLDLFAVSVNYTMADSNLYAFSPDEGLLQIDPNQFKVENRWGMNAFEESYSQSDFTKFLYVKNQMPASEFQRLGALLDSIPLIENSSKTFANVLQISFARDSSIIFQLNKILNSEEKLASVLSVWKQKSDWVNPAIRRLFKKKKRTPLDNRRLFRWCLAELAPTPLTFYRQIPWTPIWVDRVPASDHGVSIVNAGDYLCVAMWWEQFPGIAFVNRKTGKIAWINSQAGLPSSSVQRLLRVSNEEILAAHDQGFSLIDVKTQRVKANYLFGEGGLPYYNGRDLRLSIVSRSAMLFACGRQIVFFDFRAGRAIKRLYADSDLFQSDISAVKSVNGRIFFGLSNGIVEMNLWDLLSEVREQKTIETEGTATSLVFQDVNLFAGMQGGRIAKIPLKNPQKKEMHQLPEGGVYLHWRNYEDLLRMIPFGTFFVNSLLICGSTVLICLFLGAFAGYGLSRVSRRMRVWVSAGLVWSQMIPNILLLIPAFLIASYLQVHSSIHILNTRWGLTLLYSAVFLPTTAWILQNFFRAVPREIEEAAMIDGCSPISTFFRIIVPTALPGILATGIYIFILAWDELMFAWVFSMDSASATIPVGMRLFFGQIGSRYDLMMAAATLSTLPVIVLFLIVQRKLLSGFTGSYRKN